MPLDRVLLLLLAALAGVAVVATPNLIVPYRQAPWFESAAMFPRVALGLMVIGALAEVALRRGGRSTVAADELDSSGVRTRDALVVLALFIAYSLVVPWLGFFVGSLLFVAASGLALHLPLRTTLWLALPLALLMWLVFVRVLKVSFGHGLLF